MIDKTMQEKRDEAWLKTPDTAQNMHEVFCWAWDACNEELSAQLAVALEMLLMQTKTIARMMTALEWYAVRHRGSRSHPDNASSDLEWDDGAIAREALNPSAKEK